MAVITDDRLDRLAALVGSKKVTPAAIRVVDVPRRAPTSQAGSARRTRCSRSWTASRTLPTRPAIRDLKLEMVVADRDRRAAPREGEDAKSGDPALRKELAEVEDVLAHLEAGRPLSDWPASCRPRSSR